MANKCKGNKISFLLRLTLQCFRPWRNIPSKSSRILDNPPYVDQTFVFRLARRTSTVDLTLFNRFHLIGSCCCGSSSSVPIMAAIFVLLPPMMSAKSHDTGNPRKRIKKYLFFTYTCGRIGYLLLKQEIQKCQWVFSLTNLGLLNDLIIFYSTFIWCF